ncbi:MAG: hypothetical protein Tsb008_02150 [Rhodothalassiaceae bacterium]
MRLILGLLWSIFMGTVGFIAFLSHVQNIFVALLLTLGAAHLGATVFNWVFPPFRRKWKNPFEENPTRLTVVENYERQKAAEAAEMARRRLEPPYKKGKKGSGRKKAPAAGSPEVSTPSGMPAAAGFTGGSFLDEAQDDFLSDELDRDFFGDDDPFCDDDLFGDEPKDDDWR